MSHPFYLKLLFLAGLVPTMACATPVVPQVEEVVRSHWVAHAQARGWQDPQVRVTLVGRAPTALSCGAPLQVELVDARHATRMQVKATCPGTEGWVHSFVARVAIEAGVLESAQPIESGRPLGEQDVRSARHEVTNALDALARPEQVLGHAARRRLREGQLLQERLLEPAVLVRRGSKVRIVVRAGGVTVENAGESLQAGALGDTVRVRNTASGKTLSARVTDEGVVEPAE